MVQRLDTERNRLEDILRRYNTVGLFMLVLLQFSVLIDMRCTAWCCWCAAWQDWVTHSEGGSLRYQNRRDDCQNWYHERNNRLRSRAGWNAKRGSAESSWKLRNCSGLRRWSTSRWLAGFLLQKSLFPGVTILQKRWTCRLSMDRQRSNAWYSKRRYNL